MITAEQMLAEAGLVDEMAAGTRPGLAAALAALEVETGLSAAGRDRVLAQFRDNLARLAAIVADRAAHPAIADVAIARPVFILGLPRCGTSVLHALIGADPAVRTPLQWEVAAPSPPARSRHLRQRSARRQVSMPMSPRTSPAPGPMC